MNVIVSNLNASKFLNLDVDVIKSINGEFTVDEIIQSFSNFFFNRMFLDITAIENYQDINTLKKLSVGLDVSKIILLLSNDSVVNSNTYVSSLISMGIYNFAHDVDEMKYLYNNPNTYKDVAHLQKIDEVVVSPTPSVSVSDTVVRSGVRVIGFKNFTNHAGATSLIYMLKKQLSRNYYTIAIEINKRDFMFYQDKDMISCSAGDISQTIQNYKDANIVLVDLNDLDLSTSRSICQDIIYLMESSTLMINRLVMLDQKCFDKVQEQKIVLNCSLLNEADVKTLQEEAHIDFFHVLPPMNDREDNSNNLFPFLEKLGLYRRV